MVNHYCDRCLDTGKVLGWLTVFPSLGGIELPIPWENTCPQCVGDPYGYWRREKWPAIEAARPAAPVGSGRVMPRPSDAPTLSPPPPPPPKRYPCRGGCC